MEQNKYTYQDAFEELQGIVLAMEAGDITVDQLTQQVQRAASLMEICRAKLQATEEEVDVLLAKLAAKENEQNLDEQDGTLA